MVDIITYDNKQYKIVFNKQYTNIWVWEYSILAIPLKSSHWSIYLGYIAKTRKNTKPIISLHKLNEYHFGNNYNEVKQTAIKLIKEIYNDTNK